MVFMAGMLVTKGSWPTKYETREVLLMKKDEEPLISPIPKDMPSEKSEIKQFSKILKESWPGILEIKDNESQTIRYKRTALSNKNGFIDLKNGPYSIIAYFTNSSGTGFGIVYDGEKNFFPLLWHPGATKAPTLNPGTINLLNGRRIEIGKIQE